MPVVINEKFQLQGDELTMQDAEMVKARGMKLVDEAAGPQVRADFGGLQRANSVTVAVMLAWHRHALLHDKSIEFTHLSAELGNIIEFSGLRSLLLTQPAAGGDSTISAEGETNH